MKSYMDKIRKILRKNPYVIFAYLFGSRAAGYAGIRSDWDIAIYFDKPAPRDWTRFYLEAEIEKELRERVQITILNGIEDPVFAFEIISKGIILIDRKPSARILFEAFTLRQHHDWNYYLQRHVIA